MSIDFTGGNPTETPNGQDHVPAGGNPADGSQDQGFAIEYNGRKLTQEEVLKKLEHADSHIGTLTSEREADRLRLEALEAAVAKASKVEDVLKALQGKEEGSTPATVEPNPANQGNDIESQLDELLNKRELARSSETNWTHVTTELAKAFGSKTNDKVAEVAQENDMTLEEAQAFARSKPKAFLKLFGRLSAPQSHVTTNGFRNSFAQHEETSAPTGYMEAKTSKDQISIYQRALAKHGL